MAEPVGTRQGRSLTLHKRAECAPLTEPASPLPAAQDMKRGALNKKNGLGATGEKPSFEFASQRATQESASFGNVLSSHGREQ